MKTKSSRKPADHDDLRPEYDFSKMKGRPNRFAAPLRAGGALVVIDPDVAAVFPDSAAVNSLLRSVIKAVKPKAASRKGAA